MDFQIDWIYRILGAALGGFLIGFERKTRLKEAGLRTHSIVSIGSALFTIISLYGFQGAADASRIAAQIVTGIGFLGAGMIVFRRNSLYGLTTAAGIWTVAGIGMAFGAGMYELGFCTTVIIIIIQFLLHSKNRIFSMKKTTTLVIECDAEDYVVEKIQEMFHVDNVFRTKIVKNTDGYSMILTVQTFDVFSVETLLKFVKENTFIKRIDNSEE